MPGFTPPYSSDQHDNRASIPVRVVMGGVGSTTTPLGYQQITSLANPTGLAVPAGATTAVLEVSGQAVRYRDDGTAPTATVGMPVPAGQQISYSGNLAAIQFIQQAASATLDVLFYR